MPIQFPDILLNSLENGHMIIDDKFIVTYWNRWLSINTQISQDEIVGKSLEDFYPDLNYYVLKRKIKTALQLGTPSFYDPNSNTKFISINRNKVTTSSLKLMQQQVTITPYIIEKNQVMISIYDISELFETKLLLQQEIEKVKKLNLVLENDRKIMDQNIMMIKTSPDGIISEASVLFCDFFGFPRENIIGKNATQICKREGGDAIFAKLQKIIQNKETWYGELEVKTQSNVSKWVETKIVPIYDSSDNLVEFNIYYYDISNKKLLEILSVTDSLTKLYNRAYFDNLTNNITKHQRKADIDFALVLVDIDFFKHINDTYGHQVGDMTLKAFASTLQNSLRDNDIIARWGGEEFIIMLKNITIDEAKTIAEKLRNNIKNKKIENLVTTTASFGITKYRAGESIDATFKRVDNALYEAKKNGRDRVIVN